MIKSYQSSGKFGVKRVENSAKRSIDRDRGSSADIGNGGSAPRFLCAMIGKRMLQNVGSKVFSE